MEQPKSKLHWEKQKEEQVKRKTLLWFLWLSSARLSCHFSHFGCLIKTYFLMNTCFVVKYVRNFILLCSARGNVNRICKIEIAEYPHWKPFPLWHLALFSTSSSETLFWPYLALFTVTAFSKWRAKKWNFVNFDQTFLTVTWN